MEQREIRDRAARLAPDFVSLHPGYACYNHRVALGYNDRERAALAVKNAAGKRFTYRGTH
jgi:hypothetical protein